MHKDDSDVDVKRKHDAGLEETKNKANDRGSFISSHILDTGEWEKETPLARLLHKGCFSEAMQLLHDMSPVKVDLELRTLSPMSEYVLWCAFLDAVYSETLKKTQFELLQGYLNVFLKVSRREKKNQQKRMVLRWADRVSFHTYNIYILYII